MDQKLWCIKLSPCYLCPVSVFLISDVFVVFFFLQRQATVRCIILISFMFNLYVIVFCTVTHTN